MTKRTRSKSLVLAILALTNTHSGAPAMANDLTQSEPVTLINVFEVPKDRIDATIGSWEKARNFLRQQPGYISTSLHQALDPGARFQLINMAKWESPEAFHAAISKMRQSSLGKEMNGTVFHAALFQVVRSDGGLEK
ncbi:antibiotic biosynthesis monooxygenase family protein [Roseibium sp. HPY-6]|uniref:antibiotic biosynthesis monooxygenase family protein n=1 Tax=Roseibium sp. HPY-6 TaxID=3229852 RepID=UPI00339041D8